MLYVATLNVATGFSVTLVQAKSEAIMIKTGIRWLILIIVMFVDCKCAYGVSSLWLMGFQPIVSYSGGDSQRDSTFIGTWHLCGDYLL